MIGCTHKVVIDTDALGVGTHFAECDCGITTGQVSIGCDADDTEECPTCQAILNPDSYCPHCSPYAWIGPTP